MFTLIVQKQELYEQGSHTTLLNAGNTICSQIGDDLTKRKGAMQRYKNLMNSDNGLNLDGRVFMRTLYT